MTPLPPSSGLPSSRAPSLGGRVQRDVRLQAALALVVGIAVVAVPLFIWRGKQKHDERAAAASASASASALEDAGAPVVSFGDAGASLSIDAGGRTISFAEPRYLKCQDPGPTKTPPEKCDHLGTLEELVTRTITEKVSTCLPTLATAQTVNFVVDVSFKRRKMRLKDGKEGSSMPAKDRKKLVSCLEKGLVVPNLDSVPHTHQRYLFQFVATFGPTSAAPAVPAGPAVAPPPPIGGPTAPP
jgi:hypothetical protein